MKITEEIEKFFKSKSYKWILWVLAELLLLGIVFALGIRVGLHKAKYSYQWGANYERNFAGPKFGQQRGPDGPRGPQGIDNRSAGPMGFFRDFPGNEMRNAHGIAGNIVSISDSNIVIKNPENKENTVMVDDNTLIKSGRYDIKIGDLKAGQDIVVMGKPSDSGVISAELIRVFEKR